MTRIAILRAAQRRRSPLTRAASVLSYGLIVGLVAVVAILAVDVTGSGIRDLFLQVANQLPGGQQAAAESGEGPPACTSDGQQDCVVRAPRVAASPCIGDGEQDCVVQAPRVAEQACSGPGESECIATGALEAAVPIPTTLTSCQALLSAGITRSGTYTITPAGLSPVEVTCDMVFDGGGWIVIGHDREDLSVDNGCESQSCVVYTVTYDLPQATVLALAAAAGEIEQSFHKACLGSVITRDDGLTSNNAITRLGGSGFVHLTAAAHFDGVTPNCNLNDSTERVTNHRFVDVADILPIGELRGGDAGDSGEHAFYRLGKLYLR